jgi:hypothetical protein
MFTYVISHTIHLLIIIFSVSFVLSSEVSISTLLPVTALESSRKAPVNY